MALQESRQIVNRALLYYTALGIIATVVNLIDVLGGTICKMMNKRSSIPLWKNHDIVV